MRPPPQMIPYSKKSKAAAKYFPMARKKKMSATQAAYHNQLIQQLYFAQASAPTALAWTNGTTSSTMMTNPLFTISTTCGNIVSVTVPAVCPDYWQPDDYPRRPIGYPPEPVYEHPARMPIYKVQDGKPTTIRLPDDALIDVKSDGSYVINDANAHVVYRASRVRDFNSYLNASDKLEDFIRYCGEQGVRQDEMLSIPIRHFIAWLVVEAALADGEEPPAALPDLRDFCEPPKLLEAAE